MCPGGGGGRFGALLWEKMRYVWRKTNVARRWGGRLGDGSSAPGTSLPHISGRKCSSVCMCGNKREFRNDPREEKPANAVLNSCPRLSSSQMPNRVACLSNSLPLPPLPTLGNPKSEAEGGSVQHRTQDTGQGGRGSPPTPICIISQGGKGGRARKTWQAEKGGRSKEDIYPVRADASEKKWEGGHFCFTSGGWKRGSTYS